MRLGVTRIRPSPGTPDGSCRQADGEESAMIRRSRFGVLLSVLIGIGCPALAAPEQSQPTVNGKTLSQWIESLNTTAPRPLIYRAAPIRRGAASSDTL
jgi:hypothetical protein